MKTLLKNGKIYDGSGKAAYLGDVLFDGEKIIEVASSISCEDATVIDLEGLSVAPGFIDAHSHNDWFAVKKNPIPYFEPFVRQGITTFVAGNCGLSISGCPETSPHKDKVGAGLFHNRDLTGYFGSIKEFFDEVDKNSPANIAAGVGHCSARTAIAGYENRDLTETEMKTMLDIIDKDLSDGACLASLGMMYEPGLYAKPKELREVAKLCEKHNKPLTVHARALSAVSMAYPNPLGRAHNLLALDELYDMAKGLKLKLHYSHVIFVGKNSFKTEKEVVEIFDRMKADGIDIMFDMYSETLGVSVITVIAPAWWLAMTQEQKKKGINKLKFKAMATISKKLLGFDFADMTIAYLGEGNEKFEGKNVAQIAKELGMSELDAYIYLCDISNNKGRINMGQYSTPEIISRLSKNPLALYMTDAWIEENGIQNPATYDCFPKFLHLSLNGKGDSVEQTVRKMSGAVADRFMLPSRGYLKSGCFADITVFDESELKVTLPDQFKPFGIKEVFINGKHVLSGNTLDETLFRTAGKAIRVK